MLLVWCSRCGRGMWRARVCLVRCGSMVCLVRGRLWVLSRLQISIPLASTSCHMTWCPSHVTRTSNHVTWGSCHVTWGPSTSKASSHVTWRSCHVTWASSHVIWTSHHVTSTSFIFTTLSWIQSGTGKWLQSTFHSGTSLIRFHSEIRTRVAVSVITRRVVRGRVAMCGRGVAIRTTRRDIPTRLVIFMLRGCPRRCGSKLLYHWPGGGDSPSGRG